MKPGEKKNLSSRRTQVSFAVTAAVFRDKTKILTVGWLEVTNLSAEHSDKHHGRSTIQQMEEAGSSETLKTTYPTIWCHNIESQNLNLHHSGNLTP